MKKTRKAAINALEEVYSTGKPCKYGHTAPRKTITGVCIECQKIINRKAVEKAKEIRRKINAAKGQ